MLKQPPYPSPDTRVTQINVKVEEEDIYMKTEEEEVPIEANSDPGDTRRTLRVIIKAEEEEGLVRTKEEKIPTEISTDGLSSRNPPERRPSPRYAQDSSQVHHKIFPEIPQDLYQVKDEVKEEVEESQVRVDELRRPEEIPIEIGSDGQYTKYDMKKHDKAPLAGQTEDASSPPCGLGSTFSCFKCSKKCNDKAELFAHEETHFTEKPYICSECGKSYHQKCLLRRHQARHVGHKPFSCPICGKCFVQKGELTCHEKTHSADKIDRRGRPPKGTFRRRVAGNESVSIGTFLC